MVDVIPESPSTTLSASATGLRFHPMSPLRPFELSNTLLEDLDTISFGWVEGDAVSPLEADGT